MSPTEDIYKKYPNLKKFSKKIDMPPENLVRAFNIEQKFHVDILTEKNQLVRKSMYNNVYNTVHKLYIKNNTNSLNNKSSTVKIFFNELNSKSILDIGCGVGDFLVAVNEMIPHGRLLGIDTSSFTAPSSIDFINSDIIDFDLGYKFDVAFADNVLEHLTPEDMELCLKSVFNNLKPNGKLIIIMPNRLFGPWDVTRIIDGTYKNKISAMGTHLNESTYTEMLPTLHKLGYNNITTILPIPVLNKYLNNIRLPVWIMQKMENECIVSLMHHFKPLSIVMSYLSIYLICEKSSV